MNQTLNFTRLSRKLGLGRFENKNQTDRIYLLCCDGIGNEVHYFIERKNKAITKNRSEFLKPFYNR